MSSGTRLAAFAVALVAVFGIAVGVGSLFETADTESEAAHGSGGGHSDTSGQENEMSDERGEHGNSHSAMSQPPHSAVSQSPGGQAPAGLAIADGGYRLRLETTQLPQGQDGELRFSISDREGQPVTRFDELHERRMHLIVVRRDGAEFNHLHPELDEAGTWTAAVRLEEAGVYRAFADFSVDGQQHTLASDAFVSGPDFQARPFPAPASTYLTNGYEVSLHSDDPVASETSSLIFAVTKDGQEIDDLDPYLGAKGHLVALREGDLAFLHVHPEDGQHDHGGLEEEQGRPEDGEHGHDESQTGGHHDDPAANEVPFAATFPTAGRYRLYLQFKRDGIVETAEFTVVVSR